MEDKSTITYNLVQPGGDRSNSIQIMRTNTVKVPTVGEVIHFDTRVDIKSMTLQFGHIEESRLKKMITPEEAQVCGDFVVVDVKRWLETKYYPGDVSEFMRSSISPSVTAGPNTKFPMSYDVEEFEVFIEPFRHTELTERPIAKVRNLLGSVFGTMDMLKLLNEHPDKEKELLELMKDNIEVASEAMIKLREIIGNDSNWK